MINKQEKFWIPEFTEGINMMNDNYSKKMSDISRNIKRLSDIYIKDIAGQNTINKLNAYTESMNMVKGNLDGIGSLNMDSFSKLNGLSDTMRMASSSLSNIGTIPMENLSAFSKNINRMPSILTKNVKLFSKTEIPAIKNLDGFSEKIKMMNINIENMSKLNYTSMLNDFSKNIARMDKFHNKGLSNLINNTINNLSNLKNIDDMYFTKAYISNLTKSIEFDYTDIEMPLDDLIGEATDFIEETFNSIDNRDKIIDKTEEKNWQLSLMKKIDTFKKINLLLPIYSFLYYPLSFRIML